MYSKTANRPPQWPNQRSAPTLPPQDVGMNGYQAARQGANTGKAGPSTQNPANGNIQNGGPATPTNPNIGNQGFAAPNQTVNGNRNGNQVPQQSPNVRNQGHMSKGQQHNGNQNGYQAPQQGSYMGNQNCAGQNQPPSNVNQGRNRVPQQQYRQQNQSQTPQFQQPNQPQAPQGTMNGYSGQQPYQGHHHQTQTPGNTQSNQRQDQRSGKAQQDESGDHTISKKIWKVNMEKKVIDFNDMLIPAYLNDYAFIHGRGGKEFAPNSTIELVICDYSKGRGENSVTVRYRLDVEEFPTLLKAAQDARLGYIDALSPNGEFVIAREKNNPYSKGDDGYVKVGKLTIRYCKWDQQGKPNGYPWFIYIENFEAPLKMRQNGSSTHQSEKGRNRTSAFINLTREDFDFAMVAVNRFVVSWEYYHLAQSLPTAYQMLEELRRKKAPYADA